MKLKQLLLFDESFKFVSEYFGVTAEMAEEIDRDMQKFNVRIEFYANSIFIGEVGEDIPFDSIPTGLPEEFTDYIDDTYGHLSIAIRAIIWNSYMHVFSGTTSHIVQQRKHEKFMRQQGLGVFLDAREAFKKQQLRKLQQDEDAQNNSNGQEPE